jgi:Tfp pilus assembly protein PilF
MKALWVASLLVFCLACAGSDQRARESVQKAEQALSKGELEQARSHAESAYRVTPEDSEARRIVAAVHRALGERAEDDGQLERAADAFVRAAEKEPYRAQRASDYFRAFENARDAGRETADAAQLLMQSLDAVPNDLDVRRVAASVFDELDRTAEAIEHYLFVWEADRSAVPVGLRLGTLYARNGEDGDAEAVFRRVLEQDPENVQAHLNLADLYERVGNRRRAAEVYEDLLKNHTSNPSILFRYADFVENGGDSAGAEKLREEARGELPGVDRRKMRTLKRRKKRRRKK